MRAIDNHRKSDGKTTNKATTLAAEQPKETKWKKNCAVLSISSPSAIPEV